MHKKYDKNKFTAISVALDPREDPEKVAETRKKMQAFLDKMNATLLNVWLEEPASVWQDKLKFDSPPCIYVFDKDNHFVKKLYDSEFNPTVVENLVEELLKK
jgi:hypothetical protein